MDHLGHLGVSRYRLGQALRKYNCRAIEDVILDVHRSVKNFRLKAPRASTWRDIYLKEPFQVRVRKMRSAKIRLTRHSEAFSQPQLGEWPRNMVCDGDAIQQGRRYSCMATCNAPRPPRNFLALETTILTVGLVVIMVEEGVTTPNREPPVDSGPGRPGLGVTLTADVVGKPLPRATGYFDPPPSGI